MNGQGRSDGRSGGSSHNWRDEVRLRISQEAQGTQQRIPSYFRRLDAFRNENHPSIFKRRHETNHVAAASLMPACCLLPAGSSDQAPPPPQDHVAMACSGGAATRDVVVAALGPYHHLSPATPPALITRAKKCAIVMFLARWFRLDTADFLGWAQRNEARVRGCYERDSFAMASEELAEMLLLDGSLLLFAVFLLRASVREDQRPSELARDADHGGREFIYLSADISLHMKQTRVDLLMLDNQIPFFVLAELHRRLKETLFDKVDHGIEELALSCFHDIHPSCCFRWPRDAAAAAANGQLPPKVHHLLHLFHWSRVPRDKHKVGISSIVPKEPEPHLPSATDLEESLVRFNKAHGGSSNSLDICFRRNTLGTCGVMTMPALCIHNYSERVFRSLIAFEQNHLQCRLGVTAYSICMARLLQSEADVKVMRKRGILVHTQNTDKEIVDFFKDIRDEYGDTLMPESLLALCRSVSAHRRSKARRLMKGLLLQCFPRQTVTFFVIFGAIISIATLINTVHTMYRYYHPYKGLNPYHGP